MSITIELPDALEKLLRDEASKSGKTTGELASERLADLYAGIELEAVEALRESFAEEGGDVSLEEGFASLRARLKARAV